MDIAKAKGDKVDKLLMSDWQRTYKGSLGRNRPRMIFGMEHQTKDSWSLWGQKLSKTHTPTFKLFSPLNI